MATRKAGQATTVKPTVVQLAGMILDIVRKRVQVAETSAEMKALRENFRSAYRADKSIKAQLIKHFTALGDDGKAGLSLVNRLCKQVDEPVNPAVQKTKRAENAIATVAKTNVQLLVRQLEAMGYKVTPPPLAAVGGRTRQAATQQQQAA